VVDVLSCKDLVINKVDVIPFELGLLIQGLDTNDTEKVKKFMNGLDDVRLNQLGLLDKEHVRLLFIQLMRLMSESGCM